MAIRCIEDKGDEERDTSSNGGAAIYKDINDVSDMLFVMK